MVERIRGHVKRLFYSVLEDLIDHALPRVDAVGSRVLLDRAFDELVGEGTGDLRSEIVLCRVDESSLRTGLLCAFDSLHRAVFHE